MNAEKSYYLYCCCLRKVWEVPTYDATLDMKP